MSPPPSYRTQSIKGIGYGNDTSIVQCALDLLVKFAHRVTNPARLPSPSEARSLVYLRSAVTRAYEDQSHGIFLRRLWSATLGLSVVDNSTIEEVPFQRYSRRWCDLGFQQQDPASDVRGGGALCLEAFCHLAERHPRILLYLLDAQNLRTKERGPYASYPIACTVIAIVRQLCEFFHVVAPGTGRPNFQIEHTQASTWHLVRSQKQFFDLFIASFLHFDQAWDRNRASYMEFNAVFRRAMTDFFIALEHMPPGIFPSPLSFAPDSLLEIFDSEEAEPSKIMVSRTRQRIAECLSSHGDSIEDNHNEEEANVTWASLPSAPSGNKKNTTRELEVQSMDLLGLEELEDLSHQHQGQSQKVCLPVVYSVARDSLPTLPPLHQTQCDQRKSSLQSDATTRDIPLSSFLPKLEDGNRTHVVGFFESFGIED